jgi:hypothetical protein
MAFRRDGQAARAWCVWLERRRNALVRCGLPAFVFQDEERWLRFLGHDGWDAETGWKVEMLTVGQAAELAEFVAKEFGRGAFRGLIRALRTVTGEL